VFVGAVGYFSPHTLGVGYDNIDRLLGGTLAGRAALIFCVYKFVSWGMSLGSGTSGGTLAPLFTIGGGLGSAMGAAVIAFAPGLGVDVRIAALVGMAAMFAGASRAFLASVVFAFECTRQPLSLLPLLGGGAAAVLVSSMLTPTSIMTEKIVRRGARVLTEYAADFLDSVLVKDHAARELVVLPADETVEAASAFLHSAEKGARHTGFPVVDVDGKLVGVVTRGEVLEGGHAGSDALRAIVKRAPLWVYEDSSLREAADRMVTEGVGRLVVVKRDNPSRPTGMVTRSDVLGAHRSRIEGSKKAKVHVALLKRRAVRST
jgi:CBS domain-containing protein